MNIFALDHSPTISAQYHCDQHLHKMILESAQILSTAIWLRKEIRHFPPNLLYLPAYPHHPVIIWTAKSPDNMRWIIKLAAELENIRFDLGCTEHSSIQITSAVQDFLEEVYPISTHHTAHPRIFCGPKIIDIRPLTTEEKYKLSYIKKHKEWLREKGVGMTYKNRPIPRFMETILS
jgi:hypothetical protein